MNIWEERYQNEQFGWDAGAPAPALVDWCADCDTRYDKVAAVGLGTGYDLQPLSTIADTVIGLDFAQSAKTRFEELVLPQIKHEDLHYLLTDFFSYDPKVGFNLIWDYTFFCAIEPSERGKWADTMARLIRPGGILLALIFPVVEKEGGPPFAVIPEEVHALLSSNFELIDSVAPKTSHPGREGKEFITQYRRKS